MNYIDKLIAYAEETGLIQPCERFWAANALLEVLQLPSCSALPEAPEGEQPLAAILGALTDNALSRGVISDNSITNRDLFDAALMGRISPRPAQVVERFSALYAESPESATDWYYKFSQDTNYIRRDRMARDIRWTTDTEYGALDITINLSKPEKDPKEIARARELPASDYPRCLLCAENEGYAGRLNHPARQNHRIVPITLSGGEWFLQYSPYVYYNEHCICLNREHIPMIIDRPCFEKMLDFVRQFPHYFVGSNADLPIVGGSILAHEHFQGGCYVFAMERAQIEQSITIPGYEDVNAGLLKWPVSVIRLNSKDPERLTQLAEHILNAWRGYSDPEAFIFAETDGVPHNTITPIARKHGEVYELDLALRNNITTEEHPLGVFHPHAELHHIKRENIGLIEVMGLAVLPSRLKDELAAVADVLVSGADLSSDEKTAKHAEWAREFAPRYDIKPENVTDIVRRETGLVFRTVLECAGVYKRNPAGRAAFLRFIDSL
ncbi:MAG: UDP-glucose--hexose-1-phosphate uridylyltransferase [Oscillospiraceae bacterium]|nr:UDP-glucose--hexose-1-phosphate uridylyltransferase [Oscillospiraceae bacterium]